MKLRRVVTFILPWILGTLLGLAVGLAIRFGYEQAVAPPEFGLWPLIDYYNRLNFFTVVCTAIGSLLGLYLTWRRIRLANE